MVGSLFVFFPTWRSQGTLVGWKGNLISVPFAGLYGVIPGKATQRSGRLSVQ